MSALDRVGAKKPDEAGERRPARLRRAEAAQAAEVNRFLGEALLMLATRQLRARAGRAKAGPKGAAARSDKVRGRIRAALGAYPLDRPIAELVQRVEERIRGDMPDQRTIRSEIEAVQSETGMFPPSQSHT